MSFSGAETKARMRSLFVASDTEEMTQVDFWGLYRDTFGQRQDTHQLLTAADVIKNVSHVFPTAQAMVLPGAQARFVIRGITRKMVDIAEERFKCKWQRSSCSSQTFQTPNELWTHVLEHMTTSEDQEISGCEWSNCQFSPSSLKALQTHVSTHIPAPTPPSRHPSQVEDITLPMTPYPHPSPNPTARTPPPPPNPQVTFPTPSADPPSTSLTALLIVRVLFRASFAATDAAPRTDEDHFGFPGVVEEDADDDLRDEEEDATGQRRGRKAFVGVRKLLENVRVREDALMSWIGEILDVSMEGRAANV
jgi:chromatin structure-remodeling complex subunit RSC9